MARKIGPTAQPVPVDVTPCAHETCDLPATVRLRLPTGWANLCEPHYVMHFDGLARTRCTELGLDRGMNESRADWRKRMMAYIRERAKPKTFEDADEWSAA